MILFFDLLRLAFILEQAYLRRESCELMVEYLSANCAQPFPSFSKGGVRGGLSEMSQPLYSPEGTAEDDGEHQSSSAVPSGLRVVGAP